MKTIWCSFKTEVAYHFRHVNNVFLGERRQTVVMSPTSLSQGVYKHFMLNKIVTSTEKQIRWVVDDNSRLIVFSSP